MVCTTITITGEPKDEDNQAIIIGLIILIIIIAFGGK
jgi:hypothetical protein